MAAMASISKEKKLELITTFGNSEKDTGSVRAQVAMLSERIRNLTEHLKLNKKDAHSTKGLTTMVSKRRRLLNYYKSSDLNGYRELIKELGLRH